MISGGRVTLGAKILPSCTMREHCAHFKLNFEEIGLLMVKLLRCIVLRGHPQNFSPPCPGGVNIVCIFSKQIMIPQYILFCLSFVSIVYQLQLNTFLKFWGFDPSVSPWGTQAYFYCSQFLFASMGDIRCDTN